MAPRPFRLHVFTWSHARQMPHQGQQLPSAVGLDPKYAEARVFTVEGDTFYDTPKRLRSQRFLGSPADEGQLGLPPALARGRLSRAVRPAMI